MVLSLCNTSAKLVSSTVCMLPYTVNKDWTPGQDLGYSIGSNNDPMHQQLQRARVAKLEIQRETKCTRNSLHLLEQ
jgi:hypothetical protein